MKLNPKKRDVLTKIGFRRHIFITIGQVQSNFHHKKNENQNNIHQPRYHSFDESNCVQIEFYTQKLC